MGRRGQEGRAIRKINNEIISTIMSLQIVYHERDMNFKKLASSSMKFKNVKTISEFLLHKYTVN